MTRVSCPACGEPVIDIEDDGPMYEPVVPPIVFRRRCANRDSRRCKRPMVTFRIAHRGCVEIVRLDSPPLPALPLR